MGIVINPTTGESYTVSSEDFGDEGIDLGGDDNATVNSLEKMYSVEIDKNMVIEMAGEDEILTYDELETFAAKDGVAGSLDLADFKPTASDVGIEINPTTGESYTVTSEDFGDKGIDLSGDANATVSSLEAKFGVEIDKNMVIEMAGEDEILTYDELKTFAAKDGVAGSLDVADFKPTTYDTRIIECDGPLVINGTSGDDDIAVTQEGDLIKVTWNGYETYYSGVENVSINSGDGDDTISLGTKETSLSDVKFQNLDLGDGDDTIRNYGGEIGNLDAGDGNDYIGNYGIILESDLGAGTDSVHNYGGGFIKNVDMGSGNDWIQNLPGARIGNLVLGEDSGGYDNYVRNEGEIGNLIGGDGHAWIENMENGVIKNIRLGADNNDWIRNWGTIKLLDGGEGENDQLTTYPGSKVGRMKNIEIIEKRDDPTWTFPEPA